MYDKKPEIKTIWQKRKEAVYPERDYHSWYKMIYARFMEAPIWDAGPVTIPRKNKGKKK